MYASRVRVALLLRLRRPLPSCVALRHVATAAAVAMTTTTTATNNATSASSSPAVRLPYARGARNRLAVVRPDLVDDWLPERNEVDVQSVLCGSTAMVWWRCPRCRRSYQASVRERVVREGNCCTHCHGTGIVVAPPQVTTTTTANTTRRSSSSDDSDTPSAASADATVTAAAAPQQPLSQSHPHLLRYWHATRNGLLSPSDVTCDSTTLVWWRVVDDDDDTTTPASTTTTTTTGNNDDDDAAVCFARPAFAFVADTSSPRARARAQATLEWRLLQRIRAAARLPRTRSSSDDDDTNDDAVTTTSQQQRLPLNLAVLLRSADALHAHDHHNRHHNNKSDGVCVAATTRLATRLWKQRVSAELSSATTATTTTTTTTMTTTTTTTTTPPVRMYAPALDRAAVAAAVRAALLDACVDYVRARRGDTCDGDVRATPSPVLSYDADNTNNNDTSKATWLDYFTLPSAHDAVAADAHEHGDGDTFALHTYTPLPQLQLPQLPLQSMRRRGAAATAAAATTTLMMTTSRVLPAPPPPEDAVRAHAEMQRQQRIGGKVAGMSSSSSSSGVGTRIFTRRSAYHMHDSSAVDDDDDDVAALSAYPKYRPYAMHKHEDDLVEATPIETTFHGRLRRPRYNNNNSSRSSSSTTTTSSRTSRVRRRRFLFDPRNEFDARALAAEYDDDDEDGSGSNDSSSNETRSRGGAAVSGHNRQVLPQQPRRVDNDSGSSSVVEMDDADIDLASRLRVESLQRQQSAAGVDGAVATSASLVAAALRTHGAAAALLDDARAVQYERDVMQELHPEPAHERQQTMLPSPRRANNGTRLRRLRLQLPAAAAAAAETNVVVDTSPSSSSSSSSSMLLSSSQDAGTATLPPHVALDGPRMPHKVARPRRRAVAVAAAAAAADATTAVEQA